MEEVDNIIIDSLRNLNCDIDEDITNLKGFTPDTVVSAVSCCLEAIMPNMKLPRKMPPSMSVRLKLASQLVDYIQNIGFRGDLGYQTILYSNETELRRVLMYLIEHVPRESSKEVATEAVGYVPRLVKEIEEKVKLALSQEWVPSSVMYMGARTLGSNYIQHSYGKSVPLQTQNIQVPNCSDTNEDLKEYWVHTVPEVTKQCKKNNLIPSLLFKDNQYESIKFKLKDYVKSKINDIAIPIESNVATFENVESTVENEVNNVEIKINDLITEMEVEKKKYIELKASFKETEVKHSQLTNKLKTEEKELVDIVNRVNIKTKTLTVLSKDENKEKLKTLIENGNERLVELASQWNEVQSPLIEEYKTLQTSISQQELKFQEDKEKKLLIKSKLKQVDQEIIDKELLEKSLKIEFERLNRNSNRSSYTKRILEIIGNIKKQNSDISNILKDTRVVQKEIRLLTGQLDRSFTIADALIFKDAKHDETARKAYKLLATLHFDCESIVQAVTDIGTMERECRNMQDQIEAETDKNIGLKLKQVLSDINELRTEWERVKQDTKE